MRKFHSVIAVATTFAAAGILSGSAVASKPDIVTNDAAKRTVNVTMVSGLTGNHGEFNFDGYSNGQLLVTIPLGWRVNVDFKVPSGSTLPHSWMLVPWKTSATAANPRLALMHAESPRALVGTNPGHSVTFHFVASKAGKYKFICAVPGHDAGGMWDTLIVKKGATRATAQPEYEA